MMKSKIILLLVVMNLLNLPILAQKNIHQICNAETKRPVPFCLIHWLATPKDTLSQVVTDARGYFREAHQANKVKMLSVDGINYEPYIISIKSNADIPKVIYLKQIKKKENKSRK